MKRITGTAIGFCLLAASQTIAQAPEKQAVENTTITQTLPGATLRTETQSVVGTVKEYEAGKSIKLSGPGDKSYSFDLRGDAKVDGTIVVGQMATVRYTKGTDGIPFPRPAPRAARGPSRLENRCAGDGTGGSNPSSSAMNRGRT